MANDFFLNKGQEGMFGLMPWEVEAQQKAQQQAMAMKMAQIQGPEQLGTFNAFEAGRQGADGIRQFLGRPDPEVARAQELQTISKELAQSGINPTDTESYLSKLSEKLASSGRVEEALNVSKALQAHRDRQESLEIKRYDKETARIRATAAKRNKLNEFSLEIFKHNKEYTPESLAAYEKSVDPENNPNGDMSLLKPRIDAKESGWDTDGFTPDKRFVFTNKKGEIAVRNPSTGQLEPYNGPIASGTKGTNVSVGLPSMTFTNTVEAPAQPTAFDQTNAAILQAVQIPELKQLAVSAQSANRVLPEIKKMQELVGEGNLFTGYGADVKQQFARAASALGYKGLDPSINDTAFFKQFSEKAVLPYMQQLGGSDSNEELRTLRQAVTTNSMTPAQIKRALEWTEREQKQQAGKWNTYMRGIQQEGRTDPMMFDTVNGVWPERRGQTQEGTGKVKQVTTATVKGQAATNAMNTPPPAMRQPVPPPQAPPQQVQSQPVATVDVGTPPANIVQKYMAQWGTDEATTIARLKAAKAQQGR